MAVGTAALVLILSIYNGFNGIIEQSISDFTPDLKVYPAKGKMFEADSTLLSALRSVEGVGSVSEVVEEMVFIGYGNEQKAARAKGVDSVFIQNSALGSHLLEGELCLKKGDYSMCILGSGLSYETGARPHFAAPVNIYYPRKSRGFSFLRPMEALQSGKFFVSGVVAIDADTDKSLIITPIDDLRALLGCQGSVSALEVSLQKGYSSAWVAKQLGATLGSEYRILDRYRQNEDMFKMMRYEKLAVFGILIFVLVIIAFNVFSSLSMLILEKKEDIATLRALGADDRVIRRIFVLEGWMISLLGMAAGLIVGLALAYAQQRLGIIKMPGNYLIDSYPVIVNLKDILLIVAGVALVGYLIALVPARSLKRE